MIATENIVNSLSVNSDYFDDSCLTIKHWLQGWKVNCGQNIKMVMENYAGYLGVFC